MLRIVLSAAAGFLMFALIVMCFSKKALRSDAVRRRVDGLAHDSGRGLMHLDSEMEKSFFERVLRPLIAKLVARFSVILPNRDHSNNEKQEKLLEQAGWAMSADEYAVLQLVVMAGVGILGLVVGFILNKDLLTIVLYFFFGVFAAYAIMRYVCSATAKRRRESMEKQLPDVLDLLSVSVAAGLGFERAMLHVVETMDGPLVDEFAVTYREMSMGRSRKDALTLLGERCGIEDLATVTGALVQAGQLGIPICNVLQSQSAAIRSSRRSKVKEKAAMVSTKMLLPMIGLIFPVLIIILLGPSLITILEQFG